MINMSILSKDTYYGILRNLLSAAEHEDPMP